MSRIQPPINHEYSVWKWGGKRKEQKHLGFAKINSFLDKLNFLPLLEGEREEGEKGTRFYDTSPKRMPQMCLGFGTRPPEPDVFPSATKMAIDKGGGIGEF